MFILDSLLVGGLRFVFDKIATVVDTEMNDPDVLRQRLLEAEMRLELGEISQAEFNQTEADVLARLRELKAREQGIDPAADASRDYKITGIDASFEGDEH
jgi:Gas vesicle protein G